MEPAREPSPNSSSPYSDVEEESEDNSELDETNSDAHILNDEDEDGVDEDEDAVDVGDQQYPTDTHNKESIAIQRSQTEASRSTVSANSPTAGGATSQGAVELSAAAKTKSPTSGSQATSPSKQPPLRVRDPIEWLVPSSMVDAQSPVRYSRLATVFCQYAPNICEARGPPLDNLSQDDDDDSPQAIVDHGLYKVHIE